MTMPFTEAIRNAGILTLLTLGTAYSHSLLAAGTDGTAKSGTEAQRTILEIVHYSRNQAYRQTEPPSPDTGPPYIVVAYANGTVEFRGIRNVKQARGTHKLSAEETNQLTDLLHLMLPLISVQPDNHVAPSYYAAVTIYPTSGSAYGTFTLANATDYDKFRKAVEPFLRTMPYRCPIPDSLMKTDGTQQTIDYCGQVFEFGSQKPNVEGDQE